MPEQVRQRNTEQAGARVFYPERDASIGVVPVGCASGHRKGPREQIRMHRGEIPDAPVT